MIGAVEDVIETHDDESRGGLIPARIEMDQARVAQKFESADRAIRRDETQAGGDAQSEAAEFGVDGKTVAIVLNGVIEEDVEQDLVPDDIGGRRQSGAGNMGHRALIGSEGA